MDTVWTGFLCNMDAFGQVSCAGFLCSVLDTLGGHLIVLLANWSQGFSCSSRPACNMRRKWVNVDLTIVHSTITTSD